MRRHQYLPLGWYKRLPNEDETERSPTITRRLVEFGVVCSPLTSNRADKPMVSLSRQDGRSERHRVIRVVVVTEFSFLTAVRIDVHWVSRVGSRISVNET